MNRLHLTREIDTTALYVSRCFRARVAGEPVPPLCAEPSPLGEASMVEPGGLSRPVAPIHASASAYGCANSRDAHLCVEGCGGVAVALGRCVTCDLATSGEQS